jgi:hypothetical protein
MRYTVSTRASYIHQLQLEGYKAVETYGFDNDTASCNLAINPRLGTNFTTCLSRLVGAQQGSLKSDVLKKIKGYAERIILMMIIQNWPIDHP